MILNSDIFISNESINVLISSYINNNVKQYQDTMIMFPKLALARSNQFPNKYFFDRKTQNTIYEERIVGCGCNQQTILDVITVYDEDEGKIMDSMYGIELSGLVNTMAYNMSIYQSSFISSVNFVQLTTLLDEEHTLSGLMNLANYLKQIRKYTVNVQYIGVYNIITNVTDLSWKENDIVNGIGKIDDDKEILEQNGIFFINRTPTCQQGLTRQNYETSYVNTETDTIDIAGELLSSDYNTGVSPEVLLTFFQKNRVVTTSGVIDAINFIIDDWKSNLDENKYTINYYICHYNCYADASEQEEVASSAQCVNFLKSALNDQYYDLSKDIVSVREWYNCAWDADESEDVADNRQKKIKKGRIFIPEEDESIGGGSSVAVGHPISHRTNKHGWFDKDNHIKGCYTECTARNSPNTWHYNESVLLQSAYDGYYITNIGGDIDTTALRQVQNTSQIGEKAFVAYCSQDQVGYGKTIGQLQETFKSDDGKTADSAVESLKAIRRAINNYNSGLATLRSAYEFEMISELDEGSKDKYNNMVFTDSDGSSKSLTRTLIDSYNTNVNLFPVTSSNAITDEFLSAFEDNLKFFIAKDQLFNNNYKSFTEDELNLYKPDGPVEDSDGGEGDA